MEKTLIGDTYAGNTTREVYEKDCALFKWDSSQSGRFAGQQRQYAKNATPEGFDVWMLSNSNWTQTRGGQWKNTIAGNYSWIEERWDEDPDQSSGEFENNRVVFAKHPTRQYIFLGVYRPASYDSSTRTRKYERISDKYPF